MASYTSSNTEPERWAKIVNGEESGRYPEITIDGGTLKVFSKPEDRAASIQSFLADVFKDGDNEWFSAAGDPVEASEEEAADKGQPENSKTKRVSRTQQRANKRQEKKNLGPVRQREELAKDRFSSVEWEQITREVTRNTVKGVFLEGKKVIAIHESGLIPREMLDQLVDIAPGHDPDKDKVKVQNKIVYERGH